MHELSGKELVDRSGVTAQQLRRLVDLGIITPTPQGHYRHSDVQRIRVVEALADAGFAPEQLGELIAAGAYNLDWASVVFPEPTAQMTTTLEQAAAATGLPEGLVGRLYDAWELPRPQPGQALRADEDELLRLAAASLVAFGGDETALLAAARELGGGQRRLAESQVRRFHTHLAERLGAEGHPDHAWSDDLSQAARLVEIVHELAHRHGGRPVKLLGDGVMFHFPDPAHGVLCGLELVDRIPLVGLPRARVGLHTGPVAFQNGDYFGRTVNAAARITDYARPGEVLVSDAVVAATDGFQAARYQPVGPVSLKGLTAPITLYTAVRAD